MNRLVSLVILVAFVIQNFAFCCGGATLHACGHDQPANAGQKCVYTYEHSHHDHNHGPFDHDANCEAEDAGHESCPCDGSHQHHICIGTNVLFISAPRAEMPKQNMSHGFHFARVDVLNHLALAVRTAVGHHGVDYGPPLSTCPQRSTLCVYRI